MVYKKTKREQSYFNFKCRFSGSFPLYSFSYIISSLLFSLFFLTITGIELADGQAYQWAERTGGANSFTAGNHAAINGNGEYCLTGFYAGTVDFDPGAGSVVLSSPGIDNIFFSKYTASGNLLWVKELHGGNSTGNSRPVSFKTDNANNIYISGYFLDTTDFDPGPGTYNLIPRGSHDAFLSKFDDAGNLQWAFCIGDSMDNYSASMDLDASAHAYLAGYFEDSADVEPGPASYFLHGHGGQDIFLTKYDTNGNLIWGEAIGGTSTDDLRSLVVDPSANVIITGRYTDSCDFDPGAGTFILANQNSLGYGSYFAKYDSSGNFIWANQFGLGTNGDVVIFDSKTDQSGNIYFTGYFAGTVDFDPGAGVQNITASSGNEIFFAKYDASGNYLWAKDITTSSGMGLSLDFDMQYNIYLAGFFQDTADFDPGPAVNNLIPVNGQGQDAFVAKYDNSGNYLWAEDIGGISGQIAYSVNTDAQGYFYLTGLFLGPTDFNPGPAVNNLTSVGYYDMYIAKYSQTITGMSQHQNNTYRVYPVPVHDWLNIDFAGVCSCRVTLKDIAGKELFNKQLSNAASARINMQSFANGIYFLTVSNSLQGGCNVSKISKE